MIHILALKILLIGNKYWKNIVTNYKKYRKTENQDKQKIDRKAKKMKVCNRSQQFYVIKGRRLLSMHCKCKRCDNKFVIQKLSLKSFTVEL